MDSRLPPIQLRPRCQGNIFDYGTLVKLRFTSPMVQNHAAFLMRDNADTLHCVWFAGELEGKADIFHFSQRIAP